MENFFSSLSFGNIMRVLATIGVIYILWVVWRLTLSLDALNDRISRKHCTIGNVLLHYLLWPIKYVFVLFSWPIMLSELVLDICDRPDDNDAKEMRIRERLDDEEAKTYRELEKKLYD